MGRSRKWKPGDKAFIAAKSRDSFGFEFSDPIDVTVIGPIDNGTRYKVRADDDTVYCCEAKSIRMRKAQAKRAAAHLITEEIKEAAEAMAAKRMEEIMNEASKPAFGDVMEKFYSLFKAGEALESADGDWIIKAAEKQLYETIKGGVSWGEAK